MATAQELFESMVIAPLRVSTSSGLLSYAAYLDLPANQRSNDEAAVVDFKFTNKVLEWLGYDAGDIIYNQPTPGHPQDKPDFVVRLSGTTACIVEDKSTDENFNEKVVRQLRRYTSGTTGYCLWTNARTILGLRFDSNGQYQTLVEVRVEGTFGNKKSLYPQEANFDILSLLFKKQRFTDLSVLLNEVAISAAEWEKQSRPLTDEKSLRAFIQESRFVLDQLATAVKARLSTVAIDLDEAAADLLSSQQKYVSIVSNLMNKLKGGGGAHINELRQLEEELRNLEPRLADIDISQIERLKPMMGEATLLLWRNALQEISAVVAAFRERDFARVESRRIRSAYQLWRERYKVIEAQDTNDEIEVELRRQQAFAEQVSYVFFVRLLLARVLEDKGIMPRLVSDGGFRDWYQFIKASASGKTAEIRSESFLPLVYRRVANFYRHFFQQPVFDWFLPDDYLVAQVLQRLNMYNFKEVTNDLLGFTYETFIDRVARNKKGHFLTPPAVVEFMLDRMEYNTPAIIGEKLLDPACGSGSFLVHAARRLRQVLASALNTSDPVTLAWAFIEQVKTKLVGLEINPFSCYLAELNLLIQALDDLAVLWARGEQPDIERFAIYNTNSLEMPQSALYSGRNGTATVFVDEEGILDEAASIKTQRGNFGYVLCNPPYINRGIILGAKSYGDFPFYSDVVKGDENFYLLFLRLATYYVTTGGSIVFICPLNLFGDESTMRAREIWSENEWRIASLTRFYSRTVLFPGVLQGVCVIRFDKLASQPTDMVEIRGGFTVEEAAQAATELGRFRIINNYPVKTDWNKPWLVNTNTATYDIWEFVKGNSNQSLNDLIEMKLKGHEGDARSTWAKPMLVAHSGPQIVPLTKGNAITDWGDWTATAHLDPSIVIPKGLKDYTSCLWVQRQVQRILNLPETETALFLKEVSGLEMKRPIRGTLIQRNRSHPVVADHTVLVIHTLAAKYESLAYAVFGLLTSAIYNFFFSLFSTNAHANFKEILRLPVPNWSTELEAQLADKTRTVLDAYKDLYAHETRYGAGQEKRQVDVKAVLRESRLPVFRLEELVMRGDVKIEGPPNLTLKMLLEREQIVFGQALSADAAQAIQSLLEANGTAIYTKGGKDILVPHPRVASEFALRRQALEQERVTKLQLVAAEQRLLDLACINAYGMKDSEWQEVIQSGVPWARN